jgi:ABC-type amino acid transport substrate-binding protein
VRPSRIAGVLILGFGLLGGAVLALRAAHPALLDRPQGHYLAYTLDPDLTEGLDVTVYRAGDRIPKRTEDSLTMDDFDRIRHEGVLRVGYDPIVIPFCYLNGRGQLVGYDVSFMHKLAKDLSVRLEFVPMTHQTLSPLLLSGEIDIAANSIYITGERMRTLAFSRPYLQSPPALLARSSIARKLLTRKSVQEQDSLRVACVDSPALLPLATKLFPDNEVVVVGSYDRLLSDSSLDVALWSLLEAKAFAMAHPGFTAVVSEEIGSPFLVAYCMSPASGHLQRYVDRWLDVQREDGFAQTQYRHWIEGIPSETSERRWCVLRNVLGWAE